MQQLLAEMVPTVALEAKAATAEQAVPAQTAERQLTADLLAPVVLVAMPLVVDWLDKIQAPLAMLMP